MKLLKRKPRSFDIQVQDLTLHIQAGTDLDEESRAAALSFWEQLHAYTLRDPALRSSLGAAAAKTAERYDAPLVACQHAEFFAQVAGG